jgi:rubrerythrin
MRLVFSEVRLLNFVSKVGQRSTTLSLYECRLCGEKFSEAVDECPVCGAHEIAHYQLE